jgi:transposase, IS30 family
VSQYRHLTKEDRYHIKAQWDAGKTVSRIAEKLDCDKSTISRELRRNKGKRGYRPQQAHRMARERWKGAEKAVKMTPELIEVIEERLRRKWSPEQICGRLKREGKATVSHERIYQHVLADKRNGGELWRCLRWSQRRRRKRYGRADCRGEIPGRVSIEKRGRKANKRKRVGHLERDLVIGKNHRGALLTIVDRKSRLTLAARVKGKTAKEVHAATVKVLGPIRRALKTITNDNGKEFASHKKTAKELKVKIYFSHPYSSWERGTNENTNGLLRQYFPKKTTDFTKVAPREVSRVVSELNSRPRKRLGFRTPIEVFQKAVRVKNVALVI